MITKATSPKGIPLALIVVGVAVAIGMPGLAGIVAGAVIANIGLAAWVGCVMVGLPRARRPELPQPPAAVPIASPRRRAWARRGTRVEAGDYVASERDLYRIERVRERSVELEDCRTGYLLELPSEDCAGLKVVKRASRRAVSTG